jgi:hypothetical protein
MKKFLLIAVAGIVIGLTAWSLYRYFSDPIVATRIRLTRAEAKMRSAFLHKFGGRLSELEKAGEIPEGDDQYMDWQLAQQTSWWGKPLDAKAFWKGRLIWDDKMAVSFAHRHGRLYPPMPYVDPDFSSYPDDDGINGSYSADGPHIFYGRSSKEVGFWDKFNKTHPRPPDQVDQTQFRAAEQLLRFGDNDSIRSEPISRNFPAEAFTKDALFWAYVQAKRAECQAMLDSGVTTNQPGFQDIINNLLVDPKYVLESLTPDQNKAANAWKIVYLKRLQSQKVDQSYLTAYLQAWNLSSNEVFGAGN